MHVLLHPKANQQSCVLYFTNNTLNFLVVIVLTWQQCDKFTQFTILAYYYNIAGYFKRI